MARNEKRLQITDTNRDQNKVFLIKEMAADAGERWANRFILALLNAHAITAQAARDAGMAGLAMVMPTSMHGSIKWLTGLPYSRDLEELLDEQMRCVHYVPPGNLPIQPLMDGENSQVEEIPTRWQLRAAWLELHLGFLLAGNELTSGTTPPASPA